VRAIARRVGRLEAKYVATVDLESHWMAVAMMEARRRRIGFPPVPPIPSAQWGV